MGEHPGHHPQAQARHQARASTIPGACRGRDQRRQGPECDRRGDPAGQDVKADGVSTSSDDFERLAEGRRDPEQPAAQGRMLGVVPEDGVDRVAVEKSKSLGSQGRDVSPAGADIQGFVDRQAGIAERQEDRQGRGQAQSEGDPPGCPPVLMHRAARRLMA